MVNSTNIQITPRTSTTNEQIQEEVSKGGS
jgi:hypothetical protein